MDEKCPRGNILIPYRLIGIQIPVHGFQSNDRNDKASQQTPDVDSELVQCWAIACDAGSILNKQWDNISRRSGCSDQNAACKQ